MSYEIFCLTLFLSSAIIPFALLAFLALTGINHLADRKKVKEWK